MNLMNRRQVRHLAPAMRRRPPSLLRGEIHSCNLLRQLFRSPLTCLCPALRSGRAYRHAHRHVSRAWKPRGRLRGGGHGAVRDTALGGSHGTSGCLVRCDSNEAGVVVVGDGAVVGRELGLVVASHTLRLGLHLLGRRSNGTEGRLRGDAGTRGSGSELLSVDVPSANGCAKRAGATGRGREDFLLVGRENSPVKHKVVLVATSVEEVAEESSEVFVVGLVVKAEGSHVREVVCELLGEAAAEELDRGSELLLTDAVVLFPFRVCTEALPWEVAAAEVEEHEAERLEVVAAGLFAAEVGVDGRVARSARERLLLRVGNVLVCARVAIPFREAKVDDVDNVLLLVEANEEVVWLHIAVHVVARVHVLEALDQLVRKQQRRLQGKLARAKVEEVLQGRTEEVHHERVVREVPSEPPHGGDACHGSVHSSELELLVQLGLVGDLRVARAN